MANSYTRAGVDVEAGYDTVRLIKDSTKATFDKNVLSNIGGFGGFYTLADYANTGEEPVLVSGTDGVGTKLKLAMVMEKHDTIGIDCVAMCVNDIACHGAKPLIFLDYLAVGKLFPEMAAKIVSGVSEGCKQAGCALIGGETAEMPGFYDVGEYDLAGFSVGIVNKKDLIDGSKVEAGDVLIGFPSSGPHSNGYSLIRKIFDITKEGLSEYVDSLGSTVGEALLCPTKIYVKPVLNCVKTGKVHGIAHITGGGFIENIPRMIPDGLCARMELSSYQLPAIFELMQQRGDLTREEMYNIFNMGVGMVLACEKGSESEVIAAAKAEGQDAFVVGEIIADDEKKLELVKA